MQGRNMLDQLSSIEDAVLKLCLSVPVSKQILETEFWVKKKKIVLLLCKAKRDTVGFDFKNDVSQLGRI